MRDFGLDTRWIRVQPPVVVTQYSVGWPFIVQQQQFIVPNPIQVKDIVFIRVMSWIEIEPPVKVNQIPRLQNDINVLVLITSPLLTLIELISEVTYIQVGVIVAVSNWLKDVDKTGRR